MITTSNIPSLLQKGINKVFGEPNSLKKTPKKTTTTIKKKIKSPSKARSR